MRQILLLKEYKGLPAGTLLWAKPVTQYGNMHTIWKTADVKAYLGCIALSDGAFEIVEGTATIYAEREAA